MSASLSLSGAARASRAGRQTRSRRRRRELFGIALVLPVVVLFLVFFVIPLGLTAWMSLHRWPLLGAQTFVGTRNYERLVTDADFIASAVFTLEFAAIVVPILFIVGLGLALLLQVPRRGTALARTAVFLPVSLGFAVASYLWLSLLNERVGLANKALVDVSILDKPVSWFLDPTAALAAVVAITVWKQAGFAMVAFLNGLNAIPGELEEAAKMDGAGALRLFWSIKVPVLRPTIAFVVTFLLIGAFLTFDQFYVLTSGGPQNSTMTLVYRIYNQAFIRGDLGRASAMSVVFLGLVAVVTGAQLSLQRRGSRP